MTASLVGYWPQETLAERTARAAALLDERIRLEWRIEPPVITKLEDMVAVCAVPRCPREVVDGGLCNGHAVRWASQGRPPVQAFAATTAIAITESLAVPKCTVPWCRGGRDHQPEYLCRRHFEQWHAASCPPRVPWRASLRVDDPGPDTPVCRLRPCPVLAEDGQPYCRVHQTRWRRSGSPNHAEFEAVVTNIGDPRWDFTRLPGQAKLELQYGMQRSSDVGHPPNSHAAGPIARLMLRLGAASLLEHDATAWTALFRRHSSSGRRHGNAIAFLRFAVFELADLLDGSGWDNEYPRDVWQLHRLGLTSATATRNLNFGDIKQPWLRDCAKRWVRWRLTVEEKSINTAVADVLALRRLSSFLTETGQAQYSIRQLTRPVLEQHVAWLRQDPSWQAATVRDSISAIAVFLRTLRDHEDWAPDLPRTAVIYGSDYPRMDPLRARGLNPQVMAQVRARLDDHWPHPGGRFLTKLMMATGLRLGDACSLSFNPLIFDTDNNPYVHYWNGKMRREAYVPISTATLELIRSQQQRTTSRFPTAAAQLRATPARRVLPDDALKLTPAEVRNPDGIRGFRRGSYSDQLRRFAVVAGIVDDADRQVALTAHQWRHTFATELINQGVRLEVVKQLLDHSSLEMSSHYARLLDRTIRAEWDAGRGPDSADDTHLLPRDVEWANRARTALPNGHCGLPRQQTCQHSNKCLPCPVFITTSRDLAVHEEQRHRTQELIEKFDAEGHIWLADQNRTVLEQLDQRIAEIRRNHTHAEEANYVA